MSKLKGVLAVSLAGVMAVSGFAFVLKNKTDKDGMLVFQNEKGYSNVQPIPILNWNVEEENFVILDIGDHNTVKTSFQDNKMEYCNEQDISLGVIISSDADTEAGIYNDVDYVKGIIRDNKVDFPVYLNIDTIMTNDKLSIDTKTKLIKDFLEKCTENNIYVAMYGTDTNLCNVKKYCGISEYDALVVKEKNTIDYDGTYLVYKELDGTFVAREDLSEVIAKKSLNNPNRFVKDTRVIISSKADLDKVALETGLSVADIMKFNGITKNTIEKDTVIRIPSEIDKKSASTIVSNYQVLDTPIVGCDISYAQAKNTDWEEMTEEFEFVIIKCNEGTMEDPEFEYNATNANLVGLPMGAYCYNGYTAKSSKTVADFTEKQEKQANKTIALLSDKNVEYPVYLDVEGTVTKETYPKKYVEAMFNTWINKMTEAGYIPGLYCNQSTFRYLSSCVDYDISEKLEIWIAGGDQYSSTENDCSLHEHYSLDEVEPASVLFDEEFNATVGQSTNIATNCASGNGVGHLDIDFSRVDYSKKIYTATEEEEEIKEFDRVDMKIAGVLSAGGFGLVSLAGIGLGMLKRKKEQSKVRPKIKMKK